MKMTCIITLLTFATYCYSQTSPTTQDAEYGNESYQIKYPKTWQLDASKAIGTDLLLFSPLENESDKFRENVNIMIQDLGGQNIDLEKYKLITENQLANLATDVKVFESKIIKADNDRFYKTAYAMTQGKFTLRITSICFIRDDKAYLATFTSEIDKYDSYKAIGEKILNTFSLKK